MSPIPNFSDPSIFLTFSSVPLSSNIQLDDSPKPTTYLLTTLSQNMTLSSSPTFILIDNSPSPHTFALKIMLPPQSVDETRYMGGFDAGKFKKGHVVVVRNPVRKVKEKKGVDGEDGAEAKKGQGFVGVGVEDVFVIPTKLDKLLLLSQYETALHAQNPNTNICGACGKPSTPSHNLVRCKGCHGVWYCDKTCQTKGWSENGHKSECKILKAANEIWG